MSKIILNESNYFSPEAELHYMGSTQYKRFKQCEAHALAVIRGEWIEPTSTAMLVGSYVDAHFSGTLSVFRAQNPNIFMRDGSLKADFVGADQVIDRIERDKMFLSALGGSTQTILTGHIGGVPVKVKIDSLLPDRTVDLKIMRDMRDVWDGGYIPFWQAWRYDIQGAMYQEVRRQHDGELKPFGLAVATKETEPDLALLEFEQSILDDALEEVESDILYYDGLKKSLYKPVSCGKCDYCRSKRIVTGWTKITEREN